MKKSILALGTVLSKSDQMLVQGGGLNEISAADGCLITIVSPNGATNHEFVGEGVNGASAQTAAAHQACASHLSSGPSGTRCFYDCGFDGFGQ